MSHGAYKRIVINYI